MGMSLYIFADRPEHVLRKRKNLHLTVEIAGAKAPGELA
jgi:hypothetical protein